MRALVIGGAGFIGANAAHRHLERGDDVTIFDNLSRRGSAANLRWLSAPRQGDLRVVLGDAARDVDKLRAEVERAGVVYHLAGQVAVTTSIEDPLGDHEANLVSTLNVLESMRASACEAPLIFSSTNKVYGELATVGARLDGERWAFADGRPGIDESCPLDFHSPYGCSKGAADQYIHDYARVYGLRTAVFRQSCVYGPRQFGVESQGWLVHFVLAFAFRRPITVYGDGRQVRDVLYVEDLLDAFDRGREHVARHGGGQIFNIGGGVENRLSLLELIERLERVFGYPVEIRFGPWRQGDQRVFVADNTRVERVLGWRPRTDVVAGLRQTEAFVRQHLALFAPVLGAESPLAPRASESPTGCPADGRSRP